MVLTTASPPRNARSEINRQRARSAKIMTISAFLLALIAIFTAARIFGEIAQRLGQPAVLGELIGGIVVGVSGLHLVPPHDQTIHLLSQLGVIILLFLIGLETDLK